MSSKTTIPALLVIDVQNDFVTGSLAVQDSPSIIAPINTMLALPFATKVATQDYHPREHISFASTHGKNIGEVITISPPGESEQGGKALEQILWPDHCIAGTSGAEIVDELNTAALNAVVRKGTHPQIECYSGFGDPWGITDSLLPKVLAEEGVTDVFLVGVAGDYCVKATALDAVKAGYKTWVIRDLVRSAGSSGEEWDEMKDRGVNFITSKHINEQLGWS